MLKRELLKEKWITFEEDDNLEEELPNIDLAHLVFDACKFTGRANTKRNKCLEERINNISTFKREVEDIKDISIVRKANVNNSSDLINDYLIIEDKFGTNIVLDLTNGYDDSYRFRHLFMNNKTKVEVLYDDIGRSEPIILTEIKEVTYYPKATLINDYTKYKLKKGYILEITDNLDNKLYVDCFSKNLFYGKDKYSLIDNYDRKMLFYKDNKHKISKHILDSKYRFLNILTEAR